MRVAVVVGGDGSNCWSSTACVFLCEEQQQRTKQKQSYKQTIKIIMHKNNNKEKIIYIRKVFWDFLCFFFTYAFLLFT